MKRYAALMELPKKLGIPQVVEFSRNEYSGQYEGVLMAEGCQRGVFVKLKEFVRVI
jgi:hypothetical protein